MVVQRSRGDVRGRSGGDDDVVMLGGLWGGAAVVGDDVGVIVWWWWRGRCGDAAETAGRGRGKARGGECCWGSGRSGNEEHICLAEIAESFRPGDGVVVAESGGGVGRRVAGKYGEDGGGVCV
ncbi:hypothetical protein Tco_0221616 [Tanacetum coccineum]